MEEVSLILRSWQLLTDQEFRFLENYSQKGKVWTIISKTTNEHPFVARQLRREYIIEEVDLTAFCIISNNILASWQTCITQNLGPDEDFEVKKNLFIRYYIPKTFDLDT
jgi:hypothetical protein